MNLHMFIIKRSCNSRAGLRPRNADSRPGEAFHRQSRTLSMSQSKFFVLASAPEKWKITVFQSEVCIGAADRHWDKTRHAVIASLRQIGCSWQDVASARRRCTASTVGLLKRWMLSHVDSKPQPTHMRQQSSHSGDASCEVLVGELDTPKFSLGSLVKWDGEDGVRVYMWY